MKTKKNLLINLLSTFILITILTSCSKEKIDKEGIQDAVISDELYKQKLQALIASNHSTTRELGIQFAAVKDTIQLSFKSHQEAYEYFAALKKGISSTKTDTAIVRKSAEKNLSTMATSYGVDNSSYTVYCANSCGVQATFGVGKIAANWSVSGVISYSWTQSSPTSPKQYTSAQPSTPGFSEPAYTYSGIGSISPTTGGGWNGAAASYSFEKDVQIVYTYLGTTATYGVSTRITSNIGWTPTPQTVWVTHTMTATAY